MVVKSQNSPHVIFKNPEASKMDADKVVDHLTQHIIDGNEAALSGSNP